MPRLCLERYERAMSTRCAARRADAAICASTAATARGAYAQRERVLKCCRMAQQPPSAARYAARYCAAAADATAAR